VELPQEIFGDNDDVTISFWINLREWVSYARPFTLMGSLDLSWDSILTLECYGTEPTTAFKYLEDAHAFIDLFTDEWTQIVTTYSGTEGKVYANGNLVHEQELCYPFSEGFGPFQEGGLNFPVWDSPQAIAYFDDFRVYDYALSEQEVQNLFNEVMPVETYIVSGSVKENDDPLVGVKITITGDTETTTTTNEQGKWEAEVKGVVTVIPSLKNYTFDPEQEVVTEARDDVNFTASQVVPPVDSYVIAGAVLDENNDPLEGVTITISGDTVLTVTDFDDEGKWTAIVEGAVTVKPELENYTFVPEYETVTQARDDVNFIGTPDDPFVLPKFFLHYTFDEDNGAVAVDATGTGMDGIIHGEVAFTEGQVGNALVLNGENTWLELPTEWLAQTDTLTISYWIKLSELRDWLRLFFIVGEDGTYDWFTHGLTDDTYVWYNADITGGERTPGYVFYKDAWAHITTVIYEDEHQMYYNGERLEPDNLASLSQPISALAPASEIFIGKAYGGPAIYGAIDDLRLYSKPLTPEEVLAIYENQQPVETYTISGKVTDDEDQPLAGVTIEVTGDTAAFVETDEFGFWEIEDVEGDVVVTALLENYTFYPTNYPVSEACADLDFVGWPEEPPVENYVISGTVLDEFGNPIPDAKVLVTAIIEDEVDVNADGTWSAETFGTVSVTALADGWEFNTLIIEEADAQINFTGFMPGRILHYEFNETEGTTVYDSTSNEFNGLLHGTASFTEEGIIGNALAFDGEGDSYLDIPVEAFANRTTFTISLWFKPHEYVDWGTFFHLTAQDDFSLHLSMFQRGEGWINSTYCDDYQLSAWIGEGHWKHIVATISETEITYYVNGDMVEEPHPIDEPITERVTPLDFAWVGYFYGRDCLNGNIDDFRVYDRPLTQEEIQKLFHVID